MSRSRPESPLFEPTERRRDILRLTTPLEPTNSTLSFGDLDHYPKMSMAQALAWDEIPVFPIWTIQNSGLCACGKLECTNPGKHPMGVLALRGHKDATTDIARIKDWWARANAPNIGIPTGRESGLIVLDIDPRHGGDESLSLLEQEHGSFPSTWMVHTGGHGKHLYLRHPGTTVPTSAGRLGPGLDVRGDGGYVVAPVSVHRSGRSYAWAERGRPDLTDLARCPDWLVRILGMSGLRQIATGTEMPFTEMLVEGTRNNGLARIAGVMRREGLGEDAIRAALLIHNQRKCSPPLSEDEVSQIARSIAGYPSSGRVRRKTLVKPGGFTRIYFDKNGEAKAR